VITGGEDGNVIIWKTKEWSLLHKLKGHKDTVYSMSLHSSAKILASVGKDRKIILWNMINGTKLFRKTLTFSKI
jgi:protein MAK11